MYMLIEKLLSRQSNRTLLCERLFGIGQQNSLSLSTRGEPPCHFGQSGVAPEPQRVEIAGVPKVPLGFRRLAKGERALPLSKPKFGHRIIQRGRLAEKVAGYLSVPRILGRHP